MVSKKHNSLSVKAGQFSQIEPAVQWAWREDVDFDLGGGFFKALGAGVRVAERRAETDLTEPGNGYNWQAVSQTWMLGWNLPTLAYLNQFQAPTRVTSFPNFLNGKASLPSAVVFPGVSLANLSGMALLQGFCTALCQQLDRTCNYAWTPGSFDQAPGSPPSGGLNTQDEHTYAAYFNLKFGSEIGGFPYDGNVGVRVVRTLETANGYLNLSAFTLPDQLPGGHTANEYFVFPGFEKTLSAKNDYTDVLPSLNLRLHWGEHLQSRLALSEGMARPDFAAAGVHYPGLHHRQRHWHTEIHRERQRQPAAETDEGISTRRYSRMVLRADRILDRRSVLQAHVRHRDQ